MSSNLLYWNHRENHPSTPDGPGGPWATPNSHTIGRGSPPPPQPPPCYIQQPCLTPSLPSNPAESADDDTVHAIVNNDYKPPRSLFSDVSGQSSISDVEHFHRREVHGNRSSYFVENHRGIDDSGTSIQLSTVTNPATVDSSFDDNDPNYDSMIPLYDGESVTTERPEAEPIMKPAPTRQKEDGNKNESADQRTGAMSDYATGSQFFFPPPRLDEKVEPYPASRIPAASNKSLSSPAPQGSKSVVAPPPPVFSRNSRVPDEGDAPLTATPTRCINDRPSPTIASKSVLRTPPRLSNDRPNPSIASETPLRTPPRSSNDRPSPTIAPKTTLPSDFKPRPATPEDATDKYLTPPRDSSSGPKKQGRTPRVSTKKYDPGDSTPETLPSPASSSDTSPAASHKQNRPEGRQAPRRNTKFDLSDDAPSRTCMPGGTSQKVRSDDGVDKIPNHRRDSSCMAARRLFQDEVEDWDEEEEEVRFDAEPGAFAVGLGNRIKARSKESIGDSCTEQGTFSKSITSSGTSNSASGLWTIPTPTTSYNPSTDHSEFMTAETSPVVSTAWRPPEQATTVEVIENESKTSNPILKPHQWISGTVCGLVLLALVIAVPLVLTADPSPEQVLYASPSPMPANNTMPPTPVPTNAPETAAPTSAQRFKDFYDLVGNISSTVDLVISGPQRRAVQWLANLDPAQLDPMDPTLVEEIQDRYVAVLFYYAIALDTKTDSPADWWLRESSICEWNEITEDNVQGILCLDPSRPTVVTNIVVERANIDGTIPSEIGHFNSLWTLNLNQNGLGGSIPSELANCVELDTLILSSNELTGSIPLSFTAGAFPRLRSLSLSANKLLGPLPIGLFSLTSLETLEFFRNNIQNGIPTEIGNLSSLRYLDMGENPTLGSSIPTEIGFLANLEVLMIADSGLVSSLPFELGRLTNLKNINLRSNDLEGTLPQELASLGQLTSINLLFNLLTGTIPDLSRLTTLEEFNFSNNDLVGTVDSLCNSNPNLTKACADGTAAVACSCCEDLGGSICYQ